MADHDKKIRLSSPNSLSNDFLFLIDTGAAVSLVKIEKINKLNTFYDKNHQINLKGIGNDQVQTYGKVELNLFNRENVKFQFAFHVIPTEYTNVPYDGILGHDFLTKYKARIDFGNNTLGLARDPVENIVIPARCEFNMPIRIISDLEYGILNLNALDLPKQILIKDNLLINRNLQYYPVLNISENEICIQKPIFNLIEVEFPSYHNICNFSANTSNIRDRDNLLLENIRTDHLNAEEKTTLLQICQNYQDIFHLPGDLLTTTQTLQHKIDVTDPNPVFTKTYRYPKVHEEEVNKQMGKMLEQDIIQPSKSAFNSPVWVVPKKMDASGEKKWRIVIDYRKLNEITVSDSHPLPLIEDILDQLGDSIYFSTLDLASGFHQINMSNEDKAKTAFSTPLGHYEFNRMPFGLKNAPATFQRLMNSVLAGLQGVKCFVYLDDIVIYGKTLNEHNDKLIEVFNRLREHNLKLQPDKCEFLKKEVAYLGHIITSDGVRPNPDKITAILNMKEPNNQKHIKSFLGLVGYYRKFIPKFAQLAKPLTTLLRKDTPFIFGEKQKEAFKTLKNILTTEPILQYPKFENPFILTTDASNEAIGAVLSQGDIGSDLPIAYFSKTLSPAEQNYSTTEKELLAIIKSVKHFRPYLYGIKFTIVTDHRPLQWLYNHKELSGKLFRWRVKLMEYDYEIKYKPGKQNSNADALSRPVLAIGDRPEKTFENFRKYAEDSITAEPSINISALENINNLVLFYTCDLSDNNEYSAYLNEHTDIKAHDFHVAGESVVLTVHNDFNQRIILLFIKEHISDTVNDKNVYQCISNLTLICKIHRIKELTISNISTTENNIRADTFFCLLNYLLEDVNYKILKCEKIKLTSRADIEKCLFDNHTHLLSGHTGFNKTYAAIRSKYEWPDMKTDIENFIKKCKTCQSTKTNFRPTKMPMIITSTSDNFNDQIALDIMGPYPETDNGNRFILTIQDDLTKFMQAYPLPEHTAETVAVHLLKYCTIFGFPTNILTDQGTEFMSKLFKEITKMLSLKHKTTSPYHPQTNGSLERTHLTLRDFIRCYIEKEDVNTWDNLVYLATHAYNTHVHKSTQEIPYTLVFGNKPRLPFDKVPSPNKKTYSNLATDIENKMKKVRQLAKENLIKSKESSKKYYDKSHRTTTKFHIGQEVLLRDMQSKATNKKLNPTYKGPFKIVQVHENSNTATLEIGKNKTKTYHYNLLKPFISDDESGEDDNHPPIIENNDIPDIPPTPGGSSLSDNSD